MVKILKKKEIIFISAILILALALWGGMSFVNKGRHGSIKINDTNVCEIKDGKAYMLSADCPDHLCMKQKSIDEKGGTIVCLPNKVVIEGNKNSDSGDTNQPSIDAVT